VPPPQRPPVRPGAQGTSSGALAGEDSIGKSRREKDELQETVHGIEEELEALKAKYEAYFLGIERREPSIWREEVKRKVLRVKTAFTRNAALRFRIQSINSRYLSYERLWLRSSREKEEGTYHRDLFKARLHAKKHEAERSEGGAETPAAKAATAGPAGSAAKTGRAEDATRTPPPASAAAPAPEGGVGEAQLRALYDAYVAAKKRCNEDVSRLSYDVVARSVTKQIPELMSRYKAKTVDFKVEVKDGRAVLKAVPKV
jgi:hypothetical protein